MTTAADNPVGTTLGQSFTLPNGQVIKNRILKSAMSETMGTRANDVSPELVTLYRRWAAGGVGLSVTGNVMVDRRALGEPGNVCLEDERDMERLRQWAKAGQHGGSRIYMQLNHPGRQVPRYLNRESVSPSAVPFGKALRSAFATPRALEVSEIEDIIQRFARAASIAAEAGFDGVQIHGAHGYLVSQFLSPHTNRRSDAWGGDAPRRRRFALEVFRAIRAATPKGFGVGIKINSADFQKGGIDESGSSETILALASEGMDFVEISGGTYEAPEMMGAKRKSTIEREAYFLKFAEQLRDQLDCPLVVTGGFRSGTAMAGAVQSGAVDMVGLARTLAIDPDFPSRLVTQGEVRVDLPKLKTGIKVLDRMGLAEMPWYEGQLHRMGKGDAPEPKLGVLRALASYALVHGMSGFRRRRA